MRTTLVDHDAGSRSWLARLILDLRARKPGASTELLVGHSYGPTTAVALVRAQSNGDDGNDRVILRGTVAGDLVVNTSVSGELLLLCTVEGSLTIHGHIAGNVNISGPVQSGVDVRGVFGGDVVLHGSIGGSLFVSARVAGKLWVARDVSGDVTVFKRIDDGLYVLGNVAGDMRVICNVGKDLAVSGAVAGSFSMEGMVAERFSMTGRLVGDLTVTGTAATIHLTSAYGGRTTLTPSAANGSASQLRSVRGGRFADEVFVGDNVDISYCDFTQCADLDRFNFVGSDLFPETRPLLQRPPDEDIEDPPAHEMASIYRQLRINFETNHNRPAAGRFYFGEMDARLTASRSGKLNLERVILAGYKVLSAYGLNPLRPLGWFVAVALCGTLMFAVNGLDLDPSLEPSPGSDWFSTFTFSVRSMVSFLSPPTADLSTADQWTQILLRFSGPLLLTQLAFAVRERVAR